MLYLETECQLPNNIDQILMKLLQGHTGKGQVTMICVQSQHAGNGWGQSMGV